MNRDNRVFELGRYSLAPALILFGSVAVIQSQPPEPHIAALIAKLGHTEFHVRQDATAALESAGDEAVPYLSRAANSSDSEVRSRALGILKVRALANHSETENVARQALQELTTSQNPRLRNAAEAAIIQVRETAAGLAVTELTRLGATLMPVYGAPPLTFNVQIGQGWTGTSDRLPLLADVGNVPWLSFESSTIDDDALRHIGKLAQTSGGPTRLFLGNTKVRGETLGALKPLARLEYLSLKQLPVTDSQLATLPEFPALQYLGLDGTRITDDGLKTLSRYKQLQVLWLDSTQITDAGLSNLVGLDALRTLYLPSTQVHGPGLAELRRLPNLMSLSLKGNKLSHDCLKHIANIEQLESLGLDSTDIADWQLADLAGSNRLRILWLTGTQVTDEGLLHLKSLGSLQILHLSDTRVTKDGVSSLQLALPKCQITINSLPPAEPPPPKNGVPRLHGPAPAGAGS